MIREDPVSYANTVEDSIQNIIEEENVNDENKPKIIYKKSKSFFDKRRTCF